MTTRIQAIIANADLNPGEPWHFTAKLTDGEVVSLAYTKHGSDWVELDLKDDMGSHLFLHDHQIVWAFADFDPKTIRPSYF